MNNIMNKITTLVTKTQTQVLSHLSKTKSILTISDYWGLLLFLVVWKTISLSYMCISYTLVRTILYSVYNQDKYTPNSVINNWLICCFTYFAEFILETLVYGSLYFIAKLVITLFVLDMMFLKDTNKNTFSTILYEISKNIVEKYNETYVETVDKLIVMFETDIYPKYRLIIYNKFMDKFYYMPKENSENDLTNLSENNTQSISDDELDEHVEKDKEI